MEPQCAIGVKRATVSDKVSGDGERCAMRVTGACMRCDGMSGVMGLRRLPDRASRWLRCRSCAAMCCVIERAGCDVWGGGERCLHGVRRCRERNPMSGAVVCCESA